MLGVVAVFLCTFYAVYHIFFREKTNWPPGPKALPLLGNILQFDKDGTHHTLVKWAKEFGDVYRIKLLQKDIIVISGAEEIRDAMISYSEAFSGRPDYYRTRAFYGERAETIAFGSGPRFRLHKKLALTHMKIFGDGLKVLEHIVQDIIEEVTATFLSKDGHAFDPSETLITAINDIISLVVFGQRLPDTIKNTFCKAEKELDEAFAQDLAGILLDFFPWLRYFPNKTMDKLQMVRSTFTVIKDRMVADRKALFDADHPSCLLDHYLLMQPTMMDEQGIPLYTEENIKDLTMEMVESGTSTTYTTLLGFVAICANHPDVQECIQRQIDDVIGNKKPMLSNRGSLPLIEAAILETLRYLSHIPLLIPHMTTMDVEFHGYNIPKNTEVWMNGWGLHHDERYWKEPWSFRPERFLDENGQLLPAEHPTRRNFMAFGAGRRVCAGEVFARHRLFLFITSLLQQFSFFPAEGAPLPECDSRKFKESGLMRPEKYQIRAVPRHHAM